MRKIGFIIPIILALFIAIIPDHSHGAELGDESLFITVESADALIILDLSGSMRWLPAGDYMYIDGAASCGPSANCPGDTCCSDTVATDTPFYAQKIDDNSKLVKIYSKSSTDLDPGDWQHAENSGCPSTPSKCSTVPKWGNASCSGPFYRAQQPGFTTNCRKIAIAKQAIFNLLDANGNGELKNYAQDPADYNALCLQLGFMDFYDCQVNGAPPQNPPGQNINEGANYNSDCNTLRTGMTKNYRDLYYSTANGTDKDSRKRGVDYDYGNGSTALAGSLSEAKLYLDTLVADVRQKFVILISDGADTVSCCKDYNRNEGYQCGETLTIQYKKNRKSVAMAKTLKDAGYKVFVVGFGGDLPFILKNTLNWMAYYGGTDNPDLPNSGDTGGYNADAIADNPCKTSDRQCYVYRDLMNKPDPIYTPCTPLYNPITQWTNENTCYCFAQSNDPAKAVLSGYAYIADNASQLSDAIGSITRSIKGDASYSFTAPTIAAVRIADGDVMYVSSFKPRTGVPLWEGNLVGYQLKTDGTLEVDGNGNPVDAPIWVATIPGSRTIKTYNDKNFDASNLTKEDLDVVSDTERNNLISYIRSLKLGDMFHSTPVIVGSPSQFYRDDAFKTFYNDRKDRTKLIIAGANDGMLHAFSKVTGNEMWTFIPKSVLKNLKYLDPNVSNQHRYYVDSTPKVADVWIDKDGDGQKIAGEWKTILVSGLRKGGKTYFALDITDTSNPTYLWEFPKTDAILNKVGQSWSEPAFGKVKIEKAGELVETWVAFIGGGFDPTMNPDWSNNVGNYFYIIDIETGGDKFFKEFSRDSGLSLMKYSLAAPPLPVDTNYDGFVDKVYIGDLAGQMWVFDISFNETTKKSDSLWTGKRLLVADTQKRHPIFYQPVVAFDSNRTPWVYFGTGDRENPTEIVVNSNHSERFYAVKDDGDGSYPRSEGDLKNVTTEATYQLPKDPEKGWYIRLGNSEKVLAKPAAFNQFLNFTTYTPGAGMVGDPCTSSGAGLSKLYVAELLTGNGALIADGLVVSGTSQRWMEIGSGAPSAPLISVGLKDGKASLTIRTTNDQIFSKTINSLPNKNLIYWRKVTQ